jgi:hypothetical protein
LHLKRQPEARAISERSAEPQCNLRVDALTFVKNGSQERLIDPKQLGELGFARFDVRKVTPGCVGGRPLLLCAAMIVLQIHVVRSSVNPLSWTASPFVAP